MRRIETQPQIRQSATAWHARLRQSASAYARFRRRCSFGMTGRRDRPAGRRELTRIDRNRRQRRELRFSGQDLSSESSLSWLSSVKVFLDWISQKATKASDNLIRNSGKQGLRQNAPNLQNPIRSILLILSKSTNRPPITYHQSLARHAEG